MAIWAKIFVGIIGLSLLAAGGYVFVITAFDGLSRTELVIQEAPAQGTPMELDVDRVRGEMPSLASAMDEAARTGTASLTKDPRGAMDYLERLAVEQTGRGFQSTPTNATVSWDGKILVVGLLMA